MKVLCVFWVVRKPISTVFNVFFDGAKLPTELVVCAMCEYVYRKVTTVAFLTDPEMGT